MLKQMSLQDEVMEAANSTCFEAGRDGPTKCSKTSASESGSRRISELITQVQGLGTLSLPTLTQKFGLKTKGHGLPMTRTRDEFLSVQSNILLSLVVSRTRDGQDLFCAPCTSLVWNCCYCIEHVLHPEPLVTVPGRPQVPC